MRKAAEIYCYLSSDFAGVLDPVISELKARDHRVLMGNDINDLLLLLQVGNPVVVVYTHDPTNEQMLSAYATVCQRSLDRSIPLVVVGTDARREGLVLRMPMGAEFEDRHLLLRDLVDAVETLMDQPLAARPRRLTRDYAAIEVRSTSDDRALGDRSNRIEVADGRVETGDVSAGRTDFHPDWEDQVEDGDAVVIVSEAGKSAAPGSLRTLRDRDTGREMSATVDLADVLESSDAGNKSQKSRTVYVIFAFSAALVIAIGAVFYFIAWQSDSGSDLTPLVREDAVSPGEKGVEAAGAKRDIPVMTEDPGSQDRESADGETAGGESAGQEPARQEPADGETSQGETQISPPDVLDAQPSPEEIPVPAFFKPDSAVFWFRGKGDEDRFWKKIRSLPPDRRVRLVGHPTELEAQTGKSGLGLSRAWAIRKYLEKRGFDSERIEVVRGDPVPVESDLDTRGRPLNQWVGLIVE